MLSPILSSRIYSVLFFSPIILSSRLSSSEDISVSSVSIILLFLLVVEVTLINFIVSARSYSKI